ncbi:hypothetical protein NPIL_72771 [Nephila pilipes]|uniref:Uncharacterized protein n=1 Tax=Nephila pilipes TaxID=299642 RepID=A0A8X6N0R8_NEPPI|nr:hypothetical protein NPIL_72771 [Nephila pilipes]
MINGLGAVSASAISRPTDVPYSTNVIELYRFAFFFLSSALTSKKKFVKVDQSLVPSILRGMLEISVIPRQQQNRYLSSSGFMQDGTSERRISGATTFFQIAR